MGFDDTNTLIIGAGPAGLAVGAALRKASASFRILERSSRIADSWHRHYDRLHLHTPKASSALPYRRYPSAYPRYLSRQQFIDYLDDYAHASSLTPELDCEVRRCSRDEVGTWSVATSRGEYRARNVVVATGNARIPHIPRWPGDASFPGPIIHSSAYRNADAFRGKNVLVIGFGNSGAEIALDLAEHGVRCSVSVRAGVNVVPREILRVPIATISRAYQPLPPRLVDRLNKATLRLAIGDLSSAGLMKSDVGPVTGIAERRRIPVIDVGTVARMRSGDIVAKRGVETIDGREVHFADGAREAFDAIVLATGYSTGLAALFPGHRSVLDSAERPLVSGRESVAPGLYFCGYDVVATGMLRQIGIEAVAIANAIKRKDVQSSRA
jgi:cation diffusion facilitator CzcD-associated flavoprotein CzcO